ncbi:MAG: hypothetical protein VB023_03865 [Oscillibacter sp.]|nr:hypothetical protein [Oscillibacter sp.]
MKRLMKSYWLLAMLVLSLTANLVFTVLTLSHPPEKQIIGTYSMGDPSMPTDTTVYLAITMDGTYTLYRQFVLLEEGEFNLNENSILLNSGSGYYDRRDTIVLWNDEKINVFTRISDIPEFINVPGKTG